MLHHLKIHCTPLSRLRKVKLKIEGIRSQWIGPSPEELGLPKGFYSTPLTPEISDHIFMLE